MKLEFDPEFGCLKISAGDSLLCHSLQVYTHSVKITDALISRIGRALRASVEAIRPVIGKNGNDTLRIAPQNSEQHSRRECQARMWNLERVFFKQFHYRLLCFKH